jgi:alkylation response protein AidB-like acyl-CoA dehydrogenase
MNELVGVALTETSGGSDAASLRTRAVRKGARYLICGEKTSISRAGHFRQVMAAFDFNRAAIGLECCGAARRRRPRTRPGPTSATARVLAPRT